MKENEIKKTSKSVVKNESKTTEKSFDLIPLFEYEDIMNTEEVSKFLKVKVDTIYKWVEKKIIPHYRITDKKILFNKKKIISWLESVEVNV